MRQKVLKNVHEQRDTDDHIIMHCVANLRRIRTANNAHQSLDSPRFGISVYFIRLQLMHKAY